MVGGNSSFGGLSFAGSSVAENAVFINGLNVTDMYTRRGFSTRAVRLLQGVSGQDRRILGSSFGRSTGGVINAVTRSGSNEFEGGVEVTAEPSAWRSSGGDHFHRDGTPHSYGSRDNNSFLKTNVWGSGPIIKDKLFLFAMYEDRSDKGHNTSSDGSTWFKNDSGNGFWGTKLDWNINDNHSLALLAFSDEGDVTNASYGYNWNARPARCNGAVIRSPRRVVATGRPPIPATSARTSPPAPWSARQPACVHQFVAGSGVQPGVHRQHLRPAPGQAAGPARRLPPHPARQWPSVTIPVTWRDWTSNGSWVITCYASVSTVS
ncbi:hypothetical protein [Stenotrophomonas sp. NRRL B-14846]|uniref:hypothetical protein n=1 Tax=Stenotrophomonas sp. NRRL B-14846 TaxID=3162882 RepID=UPI003D2A2F0F